jgi:hypothetical protein
MRDISNPILVRLSDEDKAVLMRLAHERSISLAAVVRMLIRGQIRVSSEASR